MANKLHEIIVLQTFKFTLICTDNGRQVNVKRKLLHAGRQVNNRNNAFLKKTRERDNEFIRSGENLPPNLGKASPVNKQTREPYLPGRIMMRPYKRTAGS